MPLTKDERDWVEQVIRDRINHYESSPETKRALENLKENLSIFNSHIEKLNVQMEERVTYKTFFWVIGVLMTISLSLSGYIVSQVHDLQSKMYTLSNSVSQIAGTINQIEFITSQNNEK
jgi:prefoldin subunit 5